MNVTKLVKLVKLMIGAKELGLDPHVLIFTLSSGQPQKTKLKLMNYLNVNELEFKALSSSALFELNKINLWGPNISVQNKIRLDAKKLFVNDEIMKFQPFFVKRRFNL